ncbi:hypothetical protein C0989_010426 [Termitomyces sp. Mn162]|nr:hypothetical protein C0989_010426 [Termitomyces sp. Mn162]
MSLCENPITPISSLPTFVSPEEHANLISSTPSSFSDIPPILKHTQPNVRVTLDPPVPGFNATDGTLYVLTSVLVYFTASGQGFQIPYPSITLHAISRSGTSPSIYCQLDAGPAPDADAEDEGADTLLQELSIIPQDPTSLEQIFEALSTCAALHPDPNVDLDDDDDATIDPLSTPFETFNGSADEESSEVGRAALAHIESIIYDPFDHDDEDIYEEGEGEELPPDSEDDEKKDALEDADEENGLKMERGEKEETISATENKTTAKAA